MDGQLLIHLVLTCFCSLDFSSARGLTTDVVEDSTTEEIYSSTAEQEATTEIDPCPTNKIRDTCKCEGTCAEPSCNVTCSSTSTCVCPAGYLMMGDDCVPQRDCGCYIQEGQTGNGTVVPEENVYISPNCDRKCICNNSHLTCDENYQCDQNAVCEEREGLLQCYCRTGLKGDGLQCSFSDCSELFMDGENKSGIYEILPDNWTGYPFEVYCDMSDGGGWTLFHRQVNDSQDFYLYWEDYKIGFGNLSQSFWLGNDKIYSLSNQRDCELRVDILDQYEEPFFAVYKFFRITDESDNYTLSLGEYSAGNAGDAFTYSDNFAFTTRDRDNDDVDYSYYSSEKKNNVANDFEAGWWFRRWPDSDFCSLNSPFGSKAKYWHIRDFSNGNNLLRDSEMKIRTNSRN